MDHDIHEYVTIETDGARYCSAPDEPSSYVHDETGRVLLLTEPESTEVVIGTFRVTLVDVDNATNHGLDVLDVFDVSHATFGYLSLYDHDGGTCGFNAQAAKALGGWIELPWSHNLLILDRLVIFPQYRGHRRGLAALVALMQRFQVGADVFAMKPFPLQHEGGLKPEERLRDGLDQFSCNLDYGRRRLRRYYKELGFVGVPKSAILIRGASTPIPEIR